MSDTDPNTIELKPMSDQSTNAETLSHDLDWAIMVSLYSDEFTESEQREAMQLLREDTASAWRSFGDEVKGLRESEAKWVPKVEKVGLSEIARANLMKHAQNMSDQQRAAELNTKRTRINPQVSRWFEPLSFAAVLGLALMGLWQYQAEMGQEPSLSDRPWPSKGVTLETASNDTQKTLLKDGLDSPDEDKALSVSNDEEMNFEHTQEQNDSLKTTELTPKVNRAKVSVPLEESYGELEAQAEEDERSSSISTSEQKTPSFPTRVARMGNAPKAKKSKARTRQSVQSPSKRKTKVQSRMNASKNEPKMEQRARRQKSAAAPKPVAPKTLVKREESQRSKKRSSHNEVSEEESKPTSQGEVKADVGRSEVASTHSAPTQVAADRAPLPSAAEGAVSESTVNTGSDDIDAVKPSGPPPPWNQAIELWGRGEREEALTWLLNWIERQRYHQDRGVAIRLGNSWARMLNDREALDRIERYQGQDPLRKSRKARSKKRSDQKNYMDLAPPSAEPSKSLSY